MMMTDGDTANKSKAHALKTVCALLATVLILTGCAGGPMVSETDTHGDDMGATQDAGRAVTTLLAKVETQENQAHWERAVALLERALRIAPRNAQLWHRLAKIRLQQGRYGMAESLAQKSNALAKDDEALKRRNAELIDAARRAVAAG
ncbi:MAG TPA: tetratricopeptide repeat protein [Gammaproteobacteria bacterium]|nr:tetratricopeptide repeat protein [Gammaproteobacteria bacterium]